MSYTPNIKLKLTINSNINLEKLINQLAGIGVNAIWDYSDDLNNQLLIIEEPITKELLDGIAKELIVNIEEIVSDNMQWADGHRGFVQLIVLLCLSEKMKGETNEIQWYFT